MSVKKVLVDYGEWKRVKSYEKKYLDLKHEHELRRSQDDQSGRGANIYQDLQETVRRNENKNDPKAPKPVPPISYQEEVIDTGNPISKPENLNSDKPLVEPVSGEPKPSVSGVKQEASKPKDDMPEKWWFLGVPNYK